jgi:preprotein translocase subunit SecB
VLATRQRGTRTLTGRVPEDISMATTNGGPTQAPLPQFNTLIQYVKDFSFENPNAPRSLTPGQQPTINFQINVGGNKLSDSDFEVELKLEGKAEIPTGILFAFDLVYAGLFRVQNVPLEHMDRLMMIECPQLLFPFARELVAVAVLNGGFPPLLIGPIDFVGLYRKKMAELQVSPPPTA